MPSDFEAYVDAVADDLTAHVRALTDVILHRLGAWDPEALETEDNERHLAIWPQGEALEEEALPLTTNANLLRQSYRLLYWEPAGDESSRGVLDEEAASSLLSLQNAVRSRLYEITSADLVTDDTPAGGNLFYRGTAFPARSGQIHWFAVVFTIDTSITFP